MQLCFVHRAIYYNWHLSTAKLSIATLPLSNLCFILYWFWFIFCLKFFFSECLEFMKLFVQIFSVFTFIDLFSMFFDDYHWCSPKKRAFFFNNYTDIFHIYHVYALQTALSIFFRAICYMLYVSYVTFVSQKLTLQFRDSRTRHESK